MTRSLLLLLAGLTHAEAADAHLRHHNRLVDTIRRQSRVVTVGVTDDADLASVTGTVRSDAGKEDLAFVETDARLHGVATIAAVPAEGTTGTLVLYDTKRNVLSKLTVKANYSTSGDVELIVGSACDCKSDVTVLGAAVFPAEKGHAVAFDLSGADVTGVASATLTLGEKTTAEVAWGAVTTVWEAALTLDHTGALEVDVEALDEDGKALDSASSSLGEAWEDGGAGVTTLAVDAHTRTRIGVVGHTLGDSFADGHVRDRLVAVSEGWDADDAPVEAEVELDGGETLSLPAQGYNRGGIGDLMVEDFRFKVGHMRLLVGGSVFDGVTEADVGEALCAEETCILLTEDGNGGLDLAVTAYGPDAVALPGATKVSATFYDAGGKALASTDTSIAFSDEVAAVFAYEVGWSEDPVGADLTARVTLYGEEGRRVRAIGRVSGTIDRDEDGALVLAAVDDQAAEARGEVVEGVGAIDGAEGPSAVVFATAGNGSGTKNPTTTTSARPRLF